MFCFGSVEKKKTDLPSIPKDDGKKKSKPPPQTSTGGGGGGGVRYVQQNITTFNLEQS